MFTLEDLQALTAESRLDNIRGEILHVLALNYNVDTRIVKNDTNIAALLGPESHAAERFARSIHRRFPFYPESSVLGNVLVGDLIHDLMRKVGC